MTSPSRRSARLLRRPAAFAALAAGAFGLAAYLLPTAPGMPAAQSVAAAPTRSYVDPRTCEGCHGEIWKTYRQTGMGRSFYRASAADTGPATYYHKASDSYFSMLPRDGKFYQRRHQLDSSGQETNVFEKQVDFVLGSGNHARTFLHRTPRGTLLELPLGWYAHKGGHWAMNPGYDQPAHDGFRRKVAYECMFCHNGYPRIPAGHERIGAEPVYLDPLPEGIDCQRCHGPGREHVAAAQTTGRRRQPSAQRS